MKRQDYWNWSQLRPPAPGLLRPPAATLASTSLSGLISVIAFALTPIALMAGLLSAWRLSADLGFAGGFFVTGGLFSRYQLWLALSICAQSFSFMLNRATSNNQAALANPVFRSVASKSCEVACRPVPALSLTSAEDQGNWPHPATIELLSKPRSTKESLKCWAIWKSGKTSGEA